MDPPEESAAITSPAGSKPRSDFRSFNRADAPLRSTFSTPFNVATLRSGNRRGDESAAAPSQGGCEGSLEPQVYASAVDAFTGQLKHLRDADKAREATIARLDTKCNSMASQQQRLERKIAELNGACSGIRDELPSQIRRIDQLDSRMWDWKKTLEEEPRAKFADIEQQLQQALSAYRISTSTSEDSHKKITTRIYPRHNPRKMSRSLFDF